MAAIRQTSFAAGELAPTLHGRTDLQLYGAGLRRGRNITIGPHGQARSRPGLRFVGRVKFSGWGARLVPFNYSDGEAYLLEFGHLYVRFWYQGVRLESAPGVPLEVVTPWSLSDVSFWVNELRFSQVGDVLTIAHPDTPPRELVRSGHLAWAFSTNILGNPWLSFQLRSYYGTSSPIAARPMLWTAPGVAPPVGTTEWAYKVTRVIEYDDGRVEESLPADVEYYSIAALNVPLATPPALEARTAAAGNLLPVPLMLDIAPATPITISFDNFELGTTGLGFRHVATRIYRGRSGVFGWVGTVLGPAVYGYGDKFVDTGIEPDYSQAPPAGRNPFVIYKDSVLDLVNASGYDIAASVLRTEKPRTVGLFEQRLVFGGTNERPTRIWCSATNDYLDFDKRETQSPDGPVELEPASRRREEIRWVLGLGRLLVGTDAAIWSVGGSNGAPLDPTGLNNVEMQSEIGTQALAPLVVGDSVLYARSKGKGVRELVFSTERRGFAGSDLSVNAQHLFRDYGIVDWTFAEDPDGLVWVVRSDGKLLSLTFSRERELLAWTWHDTDGFVERVCSIPRWDAPESDEVYVVVRRTVDILGTGTPQTVRYLERLTSSPAPSLPFACCLDSSVTYGIPAYAPAAWDGPIVQVAVGATVLGGLDHLLGEEVWAVVDGAVSGPYIVEASAAFGGFSSGGLPSSAGITIEVPDGVRVIAHVGLRYDCELELLDAAEGRERPKIIKSVSWEVEGSRGLWTGERFPEAGETASPILTEWRQREVSDAYAAGEAFTGRATVRIQGSWNKHGRAVLRQVDPLPLTVLGVTREGEAGGS